MEELEWFLDSACLRPLKDGFYNEASEEGDTIFPGDTVKLTLYLKNTTNRTIPIQRFAFSEKWIKVLSFPKKIGPGEAASVTIQADFPENLEFSPKPVFKVFYAGRTLPFLPNK